MRQGATISGVMHLGFLALVLFGTDLFRTRDPRPLNVTEVELVDGTNFEARLSTAPVVPNQGPSELSPKAEAETQQVDIKAPDVTIDAPSAPQLAENEVPPDERPDLSTLLIPPPPTVVPTEAPTPTIAAIPSPDPLKLQSTEPESPPATEPLQPLASQQAPAPAPRPAPPPEPEPVKAEEPQPEPEEPKQKPEAEAVAEAQPDAPLSAAPQEARLPVARPAEVAAAAPASSAPEPPKTAPKPAETKPEPAEPAGGSTSQFANAITVGEKDALRLGIKRYFIYNGNRSDRALQVTIAIELDRSAKIVGSPKLLDASGGDELMRDALFRAGRSALYNAQRNGEFAKLPPDKYEGWRLIHVTFTPDKIGFST